MSRLNNGENLIGVLDDLLNAFYFCGFVRDRLHPTSGDEGCYGTSQLGASSDSGQRGDIELPFSLLEDGECG